MNAFFLCGHKKHSGVMVPVCPGREGEGGHAWTPLLGGIVFILFQLGGA